MASPKAQLEALLLSELKDKKVVLRFVQEWRKLGVDVGDGRVISKLAEQNEMLLSLISLFNFGMTNEIIELQGKINE